MEHPDHFIEKDEPNTYAFGFRDGVGFAISLLHKGGSLTQDNLTYKVMQRLDYLYEPKPLGPAKQDRSGAE